MLRTSLSRQPEPESKTGKVLRPSLCRQPKSDIAFAKSNLTLQSASRLPKSKYRDRHHKEKKSKDLSGLLKYNDSIEESKDDPSGWKLVTSSRKK